MRSDKSKAASPLKARPLRVPGQSIQEELDELIWSTTVGWYAVAAICVLLTVLEWTAFWMKAPRVPVLYTLLSLVVVPICIFKVTSALRKAKHLKLGRDGERAVGQFLDGLRASGARVFHDVPGEDFNIDHVVLSCHGIFVIETKTRSRRGKRDAVSILENGSLRIGSGPCDRGPVDQATAGARWLERLLSESTGKQFKVRSAIVFPGWLVEPMSQRWKSDASLPWVLEPKALPSFIENEPEQMKLTDVTLAAYHLSRYVRAMQDRR